MADSAEKRAGDSKTITEKEAQKAAQEDYEELMADSAEKRAGDSKTITEKESQKAGLEGDLDQAKKDHKTAKADMMALGEYIASLHGSCDFLLKNFDLRREARSGEIDAMQKAKAVLNGADYSLLQVHAFLQPRHHRHSILPKRHRSNLLTLAPH